MTVTEPPLTTTTPTALDQTSIPVEELLHSANAGMLIYRTGQLAYEFSAEGRQWSVDLLDHINKVQLGFCTTFCYEEVFGTRDKLHWFIQMKSPQRLQQAPRHGRARRQVPRHRLQREPAARCQGRRHLGADVHLRLPAAAQLTQSAEVQQELEDGYRPEDDNGALLRELRPDVRRELLRIGDADVEAFVAGTGPTLVACRSVRPAGRGRIIGCPPLRVKIARSVVTHDAFRHAVARAVAFAEEHGPQLMVEVFIDEDRMPAYSFRAPGQGLGRCQCRLLAGVGGRSRVEPWSGHGHCDGQRTGGDGGRGHRHPGQARARQGAGTSRHPRRQRASGRGSLRRRPPDS